MRLVFTVPQWELLVSVDPSLRASSRLRVRAMTDAESRGFVLWAIQPLDQRRFAEAKRQA
jgi:hypothetical protein